jgi:hypothetical protein
MHAHTATHFRSQYRRMSYVASQKNSTAAAMKKQLNDTYGLNRVPMTEPLYTSLRKRPLSAIFVRSNMEGRCARKKVDVQMKSSTIIRKDLKLKSASDM